MTESKAPETIPSSAPRGQTESARAGRRFFQFRLASLLVVTLIASVIFFVTPRIGYRTVEMEIRGISSQTGQLDFHVALPSGFSFGSVSMNGTDCTSIIGKTYPVRYRAYRVLWLPKQYPSIEAYGVAQRAVEELSTSDEGAEP